MDTLSRDRAIAGLVGGTGGAGLSYLKNIYTPAGMKSMRYRYLEPHFVEDVVRKAEAANASEKAFKEVKRAFDKEFKGTKNLLAGKSLGVKAYSKKKGDLLNIQQAFNYVKDKAAKDRVELSLAKDRLKNLQKWTKKRWLKDALNLKNIGKMGLAAVLAGGLGYGFQRLAIPNK